MMSRRAGRPIAPLTLVAFAVFVMSACGRDSGPAVPAEHEGAEKAQHAEDRIELPPKAREAAAIKTTLVTSKALARELRATAVIKPNEYRLAHVSPRIPGKAIEVKALLGDRVASGQMLAYLDSLELGEKKAAFLQARTNLGVAQRNYRREERLFKQQISSEKEYLEAKGEFERSEAAYRAAREALRLVGLAEREIEGIKWGGKGHPLSYFPLLAPFAGTVVEQHFAVGELVEPKETPYTIADLTTVWVVMDIYEKDLAQVRVGDAVAITVEAYPGATFAGTVAYVSNLLDAATRTAQARVEVDNRDGRLRPGMFAAATITLPAGEGSSGLVAPRDAIQQVRGKPVAFVEEAPGTYEMRQITLGREVGPDVEIVSGLSAGEHVVTEGGFYLKSAALKEEIGEGD